MAQISIKIDDDLEKRFRIAIAKKGGKKGSLTNSLNEALELWLKENE